MALEDGYAFVGPRSSETARALLAAAEKQGQEAYVVRSTIGGYYVPVAVSKEYEKTLGAKPEPEEEKAPVAESDSPDESWKNTDIKEWATAHEVALGDATKKADMLAVIRSADKEE